MNTSQGATNDVVVRTQTSQRARTRAFTFSATYSDYACGFKLIKRYMCYSRLWSQTLPSLSSTSANLQTTRNDPFKPQFQDR